VENVHSHPTFLNGRPWSKHGLIGIPKRSERFLVRVTQGEEEKKIPQRWFSQRLDHFDPTDATTWKQVRSPLVSSNLVTLQTVLYILFDSFLIDTEILCGQDILQERRTCLYSIGRRRRG
jgi:hypothetical protein